jgi:ankyrin repeat protein
MNYYTEFDERNIKISEVLLQHGADVNTAFSDGNTLLNRIIQQDMATLPMINKLISWRASTEAKNFRGMTPLHDALRLGGLTDKGEWALEQCSERTDINDIVEELLKCGSRLDVLYSGGNTALHFAIIPAASVAYQAEEHEDW